jgi:acyl carrier protein
MKERLTITSAHPIMRDHVVLGEHVLSGLAYIDILYQVFRKHGHDYRAMELRGLSIYRPLIATSGRDVLLDLRIEEKSTGIWHVAFEENRESADGQGPTLITYATVEMHRVNTLTFNDERIDLSKISDAANEHSIDVSGIYAGERRRGLVHGDFMKVSGTAYAAKEAVYLNCTLSQEVLKDAESSMFHPALLDGAAVCGGAALGSLNAESQQRLRLPMHYKVFRASSLINTRVVTRVRRDTARQINALSCFTLEFFDVDGRKIGELVDLVGKTVEDTAPFAAASKGLASVASESLSPAQGGLAVLPYSERRAAIAVPELQELLREIIAKHIRVPIEEIDSAFSFYDVGIDSVGILGIVKEIGSAIGTTLSPTLLFEYTTIAELADHLVEFNGVDGSAPSFPRADESREPVREEAPSAGPTRALPGADFGSPSHAQADGIGDGSAGTVLGLEKLLREIVAKYVQAPIAEVDSSFSFYDLGLNSPDLLRMVNEIRLATRSTLPPTLLFEYTTIAELAVHLLESAGTGEDVSARAGERTDA